MSFGVAPFLLDILDGAANTDGIDLAIGSEDADRNRDVIFAAGAVDDVLEQKCLALGFRNAAAELPAHQRVHLGVLVDRPLHADEQSLPIQLGDVRVQIRIAGVCHFHFSRQPYAQTKNLNVLAVHMRHHAGHVAGAGDGVGRGGLLDARKIVRR